MTVSSAHAAPQGTVIKEGVLTYPAGPYLTEDPFLLSLENYTGNNNTQSVNLSIKKGPEKESKLLDDNRYGNASGDLNTWNSWVFLPNPLNIHYKSSMEVLNPCSFSWFFPFF